MSGFLLEGTNGRSMASQKEQILLTIFVLILTTQFFARVKPTSFRAQGSAMCFWQSCSCCWMMCQVFITSELYSLYVCIIVLSPT